MKNIVLNSRYSVEECLRILKDNSRKNTLLPNFSNFDKKYQFESDKDTFILKRIYSRNYYAPILKGKLTKISSGTRLEGEFETRSWAKTYTIIWFAFAILLCISMVILGIHNLFTQKKFIFDSLFPVFFPMFFILFGVNVFKSMKRQAQGWEKEMIEFLQKKLESTSLSEQR
ncbi:MAG TPA: hypothetical protein VLF93_03505 [Candidatus Saccharimonadales bacterium]|nr:hypothetical protein [Candidatus Saccharimonadales bacterium]